MRHNLTPPMEQIRPPSSHAVAVYFNGGIAYCFDRAPRDMRSIEDVTRALEQIVWQSKADCSVPIYARRDGFLIFDFDKCADFSHRTGGADVQAANEQQQMNRLRYQYVNAFLMGVHSGLSETMSTGTPVQSPLNGLNWCKAVANDGQWLITDSLAQPVNGLNFLARDLQVDVLDHAVRVIAQCEELFDDGHKILELCLIAGNQYALHQFESAHLIAWSVIEKSLNKMWAKLLHDLNAANGGHTSINRDRRDLLTGRDYTASIVTQQLSLHKIIDDDMLFRLDEARRTRNSFAHSLKPVTWEDAGRALNTANDILSKVIGIRVYCQAAVSWRN